MKFYFEMFFTILCLPSFAFAVGSSLDLNAALSEAKVKSPKLARAKSVADEADWKRIEGLSNFLPSLSVSADHLADYKYMMVDFDLGGGPVSIPQILPQSIVTVSASLPIFDGLAHFNNYWAVSALARAAHKEYDWQAFQFDHEIELRFYQALAAQQLAQVARDTMKNIQTRLSQVQQFRRSGTATRYDVLRAEVQLSESKTELIQAEDNVVIARNKLSESMGLASDNRALTGEIPLPSREVVKSVHVASLLNHPGYQALVERQNAASYFSSAAAAWWVPKISIGANYQYYNNRTSGVSDWANYRDAYAVGVNLYWNLFDGMATIARDQQAGEQAFQAEKAVQELTIKTPNDLEFWKRRFLYSNELVEAKLDDVKKAEESYRLAQIGFKVGSKNTTELADVENELARTKASVVNAKLSCMEALLNLEMTLGRKIR